jgi:predicted transcriptional regulator YdeE
MDSQQGYEHRIEERGSLHFVGPQIVCEAKDPAGIGALWDSFFQTWGAIEGKRDVWGLSIPLNDGSGRFTYMACCEVDPAAYGEAWALPEGMAHHEAGPARYAVFPFVGTPDEMGKAIRSIASERLPALGLEAAAGNPVYEYYPPDCYEEGSNTFKCELLAEIR